MTTEQPMLFMLFGHYKEREGGANDFIGSYDSQAAAQEAGMDVDFVDDPRLGAWMHLAEFDGAYMTVTHWLNIPETEQADDDESLRWVAYE